MNYPSNEFVLLPRNYYERYYRKWIEYEKMKRENVKLINLKENKFIKIKDDMFRKRNEPKK